MSEQITPNPSVPSQIVAEVKFPKFINNLGIIPTSYKDSMSYYETLAWLCKFLEEIVIPTVNENGEAVEELQNLYSQLNSYVSNYFDNLDVQEEINNKLDEMVEDGTFLSILSDYVSIQKVYTTHEEMIEDTTLVANAKVKILGYHSLNDGGQAEYIIKENQPSTLYDTLDNGLYAELIIKNDELNPINFGCYGDGIHDDTSGLQNALNYCGLNHLLLLLLNKKYFK